MRRILILLISTAACVGARGQHPAPEEYIYPICDVEGLYSANFGEMRPGHFHAGIDIKTDGAEGKPLVAVADGYVSRVSLGAYGYGRAVYLTLHNGTTPYTATCNASARTSRSACAKSATPAARTA